jgi:hypothetical protein
MTTRLPHRILADTIQVNLPTAVIWVHLSGILDILDPAERLGDPNGAGANATLGQYTTFGLLVAMCEMSLSGREMSYAELTTTLWLRYDDATRALLGMPDIRDEQTLNAITRASDPAATARDDHLALLAFNRARRRVWDAFEQATAPINDNVLQAKSRSTNAEFKAAQASTDVTAQTERRELVINRIIQGSVFAMNKRYHPQVRPRDLLNGLLKNWSGDIAIDETELDDAISTARPAIGPAALHPATELAAFFKKSRRLEWPIVIGLTLGILVSRPGKPRVPTIALSGSINPPSPGSLRGAMQCLDAIEAAGLRPKLSSNARQYCIADLAFPNLNHYAEGLLSRNFAQVRSFKSNTPRVRPLRSITDPRGAPPAAYLFNGIPICPGISEATLKALKLDAPQPRHVDGELVYDGQELHDHDEKASQLLPVTMVRHGRPELAPERGPGRPKTGIPVEDDVVRLRVMCPAVAGKSRCPLVPDSMTLPTSVPLVPEPPITAPRTTCKQSFTTVRMSRVHFKDLQVHASHTTLHSDLLQSGRARNEAYHSLLIRRAGGNLTRGNRKPRKNAFTSLSVAMAVGATNIRVLERWAEVVKANGGKAPPEPHQAKERLRRNALDAFRQKTRRN